MKTMTIIIIIVTVVKILFNDEGNGYYFCHVCCICLCLQPTAKCTNGSV